MLDLRWWRKKLLSICTKGSISKSGEDVPQFGVGGKRDGLEPEGPDLSSLVPHYPSGAKTKSSLSAR